ncbi:DEAD/DEAH box helicase [Platysternon megacephalum]|uniref:DEAD/DEAH box helicase n=1 Tax=Platysternon megacephalum TaxID=55544 RepID=A0A4D9DI83_9SAUR|nr:DEAD/DEAH box helicase [Platysternon megacephalum]
MEPRHWCDAPHRPLLGEALQITHFPFRSQAGVCPSGASSVPSLLRTRPSSPGAGRGSPDTMALSGAWPQPKIRPTLLLLLVAADCAQIPFELQGNGSSGTSEKSRHIGTGLATTSPSAELARNSPGPSAELAANSTGPSAELAANSTGPSAELAGNSPGPLPRHPPTAAQQIPTTARVPAMDEPVGSVSPSALRSTEAAATLGSSPAGATAAGGEKPVPDPKREELKGQAGTVPGSPGPGQETQTVPGGSGQSQSTPTEPAKPKGADRSGHNRTVPASTERTGHYGAAPNQTDGSQEIQPTPKLSPSALPRTRPVNKQKPGSEVFTPTPATPASSPAPVTRQLPVGIIVVLVVVAILVLVLVALALLCRSRRRSGSTSFSGGRAGPGEWAGPVSLPEERGEGQAGAGGQQAGPGDARRPTLTTFFGKRHSRVSSVAMEDVAGAKGEGPLSEPLLAAGEPGGDPAPQGAGEANGTVPLMPGPPSPPPDPPANGEFPLPPPMEQEAMPPV